MALKFSGLAGWFIKSSIIWSLWAARIRHWIISSSIDRNTALIILRWCPIIDLILLPLSVLLDCGLILLELIMHIDMIHHFLFLIEIARHQILASWILRIKLCLVKYLACSVFIHCRDICSLAITGICTWIFSWHTSYSNWRWTYKVLLIWIHLIIIDTSNLVRSQNQIPASSSSVSTLSYWLLLLIVFYT